MQTGDVYHFRDALWRCVQAHTTQAGWEPDKTAALWRRVEITGEGKLRVWASQTDYEKGDLVAYPEDASPTYRCRLAHTSQDGWEPPRVPALWEPDDKQGGQ